MPYFTSFSESPPYFTSFSESLRERFLYFSFFFFLIVRRIFSASKFGVFKSVFFAVLALGILFFLFRLPWVPFHQEFACFFFHFLFVSCHLMLYVSRIFFITFITSFYIIWPGLTTNFSTRFLWVSPFPIFFGFRSTLKSLSSEFNSCPRLSSASHSTYISFNVAFFVCLNCSTQQTNISLIFDRFFVFFNTSWVVFEITFFFQSGL